MLTFFAECDIIRMVVLVYEIRIALDEATAMFPSFIR